MRKTRNTIKLTIDYNQIEFDKKHAKKIISKLANARKNADIFKRKIDIEILNSKFDNLHKITNQYEYYIYVAVKAIQIDDKVKRYDYLYDEICFYLDNVCITNNLCEFKNDKCFAKKNTDVTMGCCHHFPDKRLGIFYQKKMVPCEYLGERGCTTKAIGCKMFMCDDINKKGYKFTVYNVLLIRYFFNFMQKIIIRTGIFDTKENIMKRLMWFC